VSVNYRYVRVVTLSGHDGFGAGYSSPYANCAEFNLRLASTPLSRSGWSATADSEELVGESTPASNVLDASNSTFWGTQWFGGSPGQPHELEVDCGAGVTFDEVGWRTRPAGNTNGNLGDYEIYGSNNGTTWALIGSGFASGHSSPGSELLLAVAAAGPTIVSIGGDDVVRSDETNVALVGADIDTATLDFVQGSVSVPQSIDSQDADDVQFDVVTNNGTEDLKFGPTTALLTNDDDSFTTLEFQLDPPTGHLYVDVVTPETEGDDRITASPDIEADDQIQARGVGGGSVPTGLNIHDDATFSFDLGETPAAFDVRVWDHDDASWGSWATQSISGGGGAAHVAAYLQMLRANQ
jgi:hypothetical protein